MMSHWTDRLAEWVVELIDALFGAFIFGVHMVRTFWYWHIRGWFPTTDTKLVAVIKMGSPLLQGKQTQVHMYESQGIKDLPIYTMSEKYLTHEFAKWLRESGAYKISLFEPFQTSTYSRYVVIFFSSEAQAALYKLTWGCDV